MRINYKFRIDEKNEVICEIITDKGIKIVKGKDVISILCFLDTMHFNNISITNRGIIYVENDKYSLRFTDFERFMENGYIRYLPKLLPKIKSAVVSYQRKKNASSSVRNKKLKAKKVIANGLLLAILTTGSYTVLQNLIVDNTDYTDLQSFQSSLYGLNDMVETNDDVENMTNMLDEIDKWQQEDKIRDYGNAINDFMDEVVEEFREEQEAAIEAEKEAHTTYLDYTNERYSITGEYAYDLYHEVVSKYANKWGISENIVMAMLTQESAGKEINLMQIEFNSWRDEILTVYNFEENQYYSYVLTDNPDKYATRDIHCITRKDLENPNTNISIGCIILRKSAELMHQHIGAAIQCYNYGVNYMGNVLEYTAEQTGCSVDDILNDQTNLDFMNYTSIIKNGDPEYLNNIMKYTEQKDGISMKYIDENGEIFEKKVYIVPVSGKSLG